MSPRPVLVALLLAACAPAPAPLAEAPVAEQPPSGWMVLTSGPVITGVPTTFRVARVPAGATVRFFVGGNSGAPLCPASIAPTCLDLRGPSFLQASATGDATGEARWSVTVPGTVADGTTFGVQATVTYAGRTWRSNLLPCVVVSGSADGDGDGLSNADEAALGTDPTRADTDRDRLGDLDELFAGTDPLDPDSDDDGLLDGWEGAFGTDPMAFDTDEDGLPDGDEVDRGTDPLAADTDGDGLGDLDEVLAEIDPTDPDTDGDGCGDATDPAPAVGGPDTDADGVSDVCDACPDDPADDSDGDGSCDSDDVCPGFDDAADQDADGFPDGCDACPAQTGQTGCGTALRVFVTTTTTTGNFGGVAAGDQICQTRATAAALPGTYRAWLGTGATSAASRLPEVPAGSVGWARLDGVLVASTRALLESGSLAAPISVTEVGTPVSGDTRVWTGAYAFGGTSTDHCTTWTSSSGSGLAGTTTSSTSSWTAQGLTSCFSALHLYCFQVP